ncbi:GNAT family N-acetyltransferase [Solibaculum mannosilyticum]|uniref:GNAT family N-acetyltransferase n=1 Tax=Solibaculum mannosilyticum TaxID=2780922 RepID=UPI0034BEBAA3
MQIKPILHNKKDYLDLLLLADEQEDMIDRYLDRGEMFALSHQGEVVCVCVVTREDDGMYEIKNIATHPDHQRKGYGRCMIQFVLSHYKQDGKILLVGTGDSPLTIPFYERCGFSMSHRVKDFFTQNYDHPIYEDGVLLQDMIYLKREF